MEKDNFVGCHTKGNIKDYYNLTSKELGKGSYGRVYLATIKETNVERAVKVIDKKRVTNIDRFKSEVIIMNTLDHPNILRFYESFEDDKYYYLVLEFCKGGELFDRIIQNNYYGEKEARIIFVQIMKALIYCHNNGISHRDLKPENFLMLSPNDPYSIKVIDFGLSKNFVNEGKKVDQENGVRVRNKKSKYVMKTKAGTPFYIAPEVLTGSYTEKCDVWSAGVILYILLCGYPPFYGETNNEILEEVKKGVLDFTGSEWKGKSKEVFDLMKKMIVKSPEMRLSAKEVMNHPWINKFNNSNDFIYKIKESLKNIENFNSLSIFYKFFIYFIVKNLSEEELSTYKNIFFEFDLDSGGVINIENFKKVYSKFKNDSTNINQIFNELNIFNKNFINYKVFISSLIPFNKLLTDENLLIFFKAFDINKNKKLDKEDCEAFFIKYFQCNSKDNITAVLNLFVEDFNKLKELHNINFIEFNKLIKKKFVR